MSDVPTDLTWTRAAPDDADGSGPWIEIAFGPGDLVHLRETSDPGTVVTTTRIKWDAFTKGVLAGEFDHFAEPSADPPAEPSSGTAHAERRQPQ